MDLYDVNIFNFLFLEEGNFKIIMIFKYIEKCRFLLDMKMIVINVSNVEKIVCYIYFVGYE